jgi:hypothetical protein
MAVGLASRKKGKPTIKQATEQGNLEAGVLEAENQEGSPKDAGSEASTHDNKQSRM